MAKSKQFLEEDEDDLFDFENVSFKGEETSESELYKPEAKNTPNKNYRAVIRFVPYLQDITKSLVTKYVAYLKSEKYGNKTIDSYRTLGEKVHCDIKEAFFYFHKHESAAMVERKKMFGQVQESYALVQILEDEINPAMVGKIKVFKMGKTLKSKFDSQDAPLRGKKRSPFDPRIGRPLQLNITVKDGWNNYDICEFITDEDAIQDLPLLIDGKPYNKCSSAEIKEYLKANSPDLSKYFFREWDEATRQYVHNVIEENKGGTAKYQSDLIKGSSNSSNGNVLEEDDDEDDAPVKVTRSSPKSTAPKKAVIEDDDEDDDGFDYEADVKADIDKVKEKSRPSETKKSKVVAEDLDIDLDDFNIEDIIDD